MVQLATDRRSRVILGVDDSEEMQAILRATINGTGYSYVAAYNAEDAMSSLEARGPFSVILLDVQMPGMNGYELCKRMRQSPQARRTPIIFLTVNNTVADLEQSKKVGGSAFIVKPFSAKTLIRHLDHWASISLRP